MCDVIEYNAKLSQPLSLAFLVVHLLFSSVLIWVSRVGYYVFERIVVCVWGCEMVVARRLSFQCTPLLLTRYKHFLLTLPYFPSMYQTLFQKYEIINFDILEKCWVLGIIGGDVRFRWSEFFYGCLAFPCLSRIVSLPTYMTTNCCYYFIYIK